MPWLAELRTIGKTLSKQAKPAVGVVAAFADGLPIPVAGVLSVIQKIIETSEVGPRCRTYSSLFLLLECQTIGVNRGECDRLKSSCERLKGLVDDAILKATPSGSEPAENIPEFLRENFDKLLGCVRGSANPSGMLI